MNPARILIPNSETLRKKLCRCRRLITVTTINNSPYKLASVLLRLLCPGVKYEMNFFSIFGCKNLNKWLKARCNYKRYRIYVIVTGMTKLSIIKRYCLPKHFQRSLGIDVLFSSICFFHSFSNLSPNVFDLCSGSTSYISFWVRSVL